MKVIIRTESRTCALPEAPYHLVFTNWPSVVEISTGQMFYIISLKRETVQSPAKVVLKLCLPTVQIFSCWSPIVLPTTLFDRGLQNCSVFLFVCYFFFNSNMTFNFICQTNQDASWQLWWVYLFIHWSYCYPNAHNTRPPVHLRRSDHITLVPKHTQPVIKTVLVWSEEATSMLQDCFRQYRLGTLRRRDWSEGICCLCFGIYIFLHWKCHKKKEIKLFPQPEASSTAI